MKTPVKVVAISALFVGLAALSGCKCPPQRLEPPYVGMDDGGAGVNPMMRIVQPGQVTVTIAPESRTVQLGQPFQFVAIVTGYSNVAALTFDWQWNKAPEADPTTNTVSWKGLTVHDVGWVHVPGSTNSNVFHVNSASDNDVAFYRVVVSGPGLPATSSVFAPVWVWSKTDITLRGTVVTQTGGTAGLCPGVYVRRVDYPGTWASWTGPYRAHDNQRTDTWIKWYDDASQGKGCDHVDSSGYTSVGVQLPGHWHYFTIFIPVTDPTTPYYADFLGFN
jgi:hypothetical protein